MTQRNLSRILGNIHFNQPKCPNWTQMRGAKMWVQAPGKRTSKQDNFVGPLIDNLRLLKAMKIGYPDLPIRLTIEPQLKKTINANVLKGRFILPNQIPAPTTDSSKTNTNNQEVIALIINEQSTEDVKLAKELGVDHVGGPSLIDTIMNGDITPTKLLCHTTDNLEKLILKNPKVSKFLGQKGLIPSEKRGTVSSNLKDLILSSKFSIDWSLQNLQKDKKQAKDSHDELNISIIVGSIQMNLIQIEQNIDQFLNQISQISQFGKFTQPISFKTGRPIKRSGIKRAMVSVDGLPQLTVI
ncbi:hypothetical protein O181_075941 [Austropuccinia psidii MF-1]|uniref:Ribosomal protein L1 n=1 Tax=Austropuccinia psidii MF-1 TaxID=1389203 RepID=A0A9Q3FFE7_9BASI|nr:hypothetical protein [Austropuccinia psidii MF-1]